MEEQLISFETAKLAKEKEFTYEFNKQLPDYVPIFYCESDNDDNLDLTTLLETECQGEDIERCDFYFRSTQTFLQKWLRDVHKISVCIDFRHSETNKIEGINSVYYDVNIYTISQGDAFKTIKLSQINDSYEGALEVGLQEALKLI